MSNNQPIKCKCPYCRKVYFIPIVTNGKDEKHYNRTDIYVGTGTWWRYCRQMDIYLKDHPGTTRKDKPMCQGRSKSRRINSVSYRGDDRNKNSGFRGGND